MWDITELWRSYVVLGIGAKLGCGVQLSYGGANLRCGVRGVLGNKCAGHHNLKTER